MRKLMVAFICIGVFVTGGFWVWSVQKNAERYAVTQQSLPAEQNKPPPWRKRPPPAVPHNVTSPIHEYLYLDGGATVPHENEAYSSIQQFAIQSNGSLRRMFPQFVLIKGDSEKMIVNGPLHTVCALNYPDSGEGPLLLPYRIKFNGTLQPLPSHRLNTTQGIERLQIDAQNHYLYLATYGPEDHSQELIWRRYRVHSGGKLGMPSKNAAPPRLPSPNGFVYDIGDLFLDTSRVLPSGALRRVARQKTPSYAANAPAEDLEVAPPGHYAYLWSRTLGESIMVCRIGSDGRMTPINDQAPVLISEPLVCADPSGRFLYVSSRDEGNMNAYRIGHSGLLSLVQSFWIKPAGDFASMAAVKIR